MGGMEGLLQWHIRRLEEKSGRIGRLLVACWVRKQGFRRADGLVIDARGEEDQESMDVTSYNPTFPTSVT